MTAAETEPAKTAEVATCACRPGYICPECEPDLKLLVSHPDPIRQIAAEMWRGER